MRFSVAQSYPWRNQLSCARTSKQLALLSHQWLVTFRPAIAEELPGVAHFANHVQIQIRDDQGILVTRRLGNDLPARFAEITLAIELANVPWLFNPDFP